MLWIGFHFPSLPLDVFARAWTHDEHARPFVVASGGHYPEVVAANERARNAGIKRGQLISAALALAPEVALRDRDPAAEHDALCELATFALGFTPNACLAPPQGLVAEIGSSRKLFGGLDRLVERLCGGLRERGYALATGLAPTPTAALLLARAGGGRVLDRASLEAALAPLPLALLDLDAATLATLGAAGITELGDARALPRDGLARRFGADLVRKLDRALGVDPDPREPYAPPPEFTRKLTLPAPVCDAEALGFALHRLTQELCAWLCARGLGVTRLSLALVHERYLRERGTLPTTATFALGAPARSVAHLNGVLRERLARIALNAPVEAIELASEDTAPCAGRNLGLIPGDEAEAVEIPLIDRLRARLGDDAVVRLSLRAEHRPEHATTTGKGDDQALPDAPRPLWLLSEAQPLNHLFEAQPWILKDGPERIESGWWDGRDVRRDYFVAETPRGELMWIYRDHRYGVEAGEWFLHGVFA
jgi:protein ImuB